jgi:hypothetical protein
VGRHRPFALPFGVPLPEAAGNASHVRPVWYHFAELARMGMPLALLPLLVARAWRTRGWRDAPRRASRRWPRGRCWSSA